MASTNSYRILKWCFEMTRCFSSLRLLLTSCVQEGELACAAPFSAGTTPTGTFHQSFVTPKWAATFQMWEKWCTPENEWLEPKNHTIERIEKENHHPSTIIHLHFQGSKCYIIFQGVFSKKVQGSEHWIIEIGHIYRELGNRCWFLCSRWNFQAVTRGVVFDLFWVVVVSNIFYFHPYLGKWAKLTSIFQMGWNHQLVLHYIIPYLM